MKTYYKISGILFFLLTIFATTVKADEFKKEYKKTFSADDNTTVTINNRFGQVVIKDWNKNSVDIKVVVEVDENNREKAEKVFQKIKILIEKEGNNIKGITELDGSFNNVDFKINYEVHMPAHLRLTLEHRYGDVFVSKLTGVIDITVKYGNFTGNQLLNGKTDPKSQLVLAYSNGTLEECNWLKLLLSYSNMEIDEGRALMMVSKYSKFEVEKSSSIVVNSKYDSKFEVGSVNNFVCEGKYSNYDIGLVKDKLIITSKYSKIDVDEVPAGFENIKIKTEFGNADIDIDSNATYTLDAEIDYGAIYYPDTNRMQVEKTNTSKSVKGVIGNGASKSKVSIKARYCNVDLE